MFKNIIVPLDLTDRHVPGLRIAAELAEHSNGELLLVHVIEVIHGLPSDQQKEFYGQLETAAQSHLKRLRETVVKRQDACRFEVLYGDRGHEIVRFAEREKADLIVMTAPQIDPANAAVNLGSVSYKVALLSKCPILLVK